jgi:hypothetical protein
MTRVTVKLPTQERLRLFDEATQRMKVGRHEKKFPAETDRGWTREELCERGRAR